VEEALRYEPITPFTARITTEDVVFRDITFPEGTIVMVSAFTGNRDLGANLARLELQEGVAFLAQHMHGLELDGEPVYESVSGIYGLAELPIRFSLA
jgi:cytochrome P450